MNIQEYISTGIIESYVLGFASAEERSEFEKICAQYPEVLQARIAFELSLEKQAVQNAIKPPSDLKNKIIEAIQSPGKIISFSSTPVKSGRWIKYAVAACLLLLAGSLYYNISLYNKNKKLKGDFDNTVAKLEDMKNDARIMLQNPNIKMAAMNGMEVSPKSLATVYWDTASKDVYLLINNLPQPAGDKQYQLWAFLDGKPIDGGLISNEYFFQQNKLLIRMKNARDAQAFAITLEKKDRADVSKPGGAVYVMGKL